MLSLRLDLIEIMGYLAGGKSLEETKEKFDLPSTRAVKDRVKAFEEDLGHAIFEFNKPGADFVWEPASETARATLFELYNMTKAIEEARYMCKAFGSPVDRTKPSGLPKTTHVMQALLLIHSDAEKLSTQEGMPPGYRIKRSLYILEDYFGAELLQFVKWAGYLPTPIVNRGVRELFYNICNCCDHIAYLFCKAQGQQGGLGLDFPQEG